jgi:hypothetical protein
MTIDSPLGCGRQGRSDAVLVILQHLVALDDTLLGSAEAGAEKAPMVAAVEGTLRVATAIALAEPSMLTRGGDPARRVLGLLLRGMREAPSALAQEALSALPRLVAVPVGKWADGWREVLFQEALGAVLLRITSVRRLSCQRVGTRHICCDRALTAPHPS